MMAGPSEAWREERRTYIGGTDVSALMGLNPWRGPLEVWLAKTRGEDAAQTQDPKKLWVMQTGHYLEEAVALMYCDRMGLSHDSLSTGGLVRDTKRSFLAANPDRLIYGADRGLEIKTASEGELHSGEDKWGEDGTDEVPDHYLMQCQWYMGILGMPRWDLAAFFLGRSREFRIYPIEFNPTLFNAMTLEADRFWHEHVLAGMAPSEARSMEAMASYLASRAARHSATIQASEDAEEAAAILRQIQREKNGLEEAEASAKAQLLRLLDQAGGKKFKGNGWTSSIVAPEPKPDTDWKGIATVLLDQLSSTERLDIIARNTTEQSRNPYLLTRFSKEP